jgi:collagenase-like PrtC family protease
MPNLRKLAVGHFYNGPFREICAKHLHRIKETFFAWPGVLSCRPAPEFDEATVRRLHDDLHWARENGIELDTLFNANCYGDDAISVKLADFVRSKMDEMGAAGLAPDTVTTTSPFIATVLRRDYPGVKIRMSVNVRVHGTVGLESVEGLFDSFYVSRERHRDLESLRRTAEWAHSHGKEVGIQANSGCLRQCPFQQFHDNLHGHGDGRRPQDAAAAKEYGFSFFLCKTHYADPAAREDFLRATWLRPEDMGEYEPIVDVVKLAVRRHPSPGAVVEAYAERSYDGDLAALMDPAHAFCAPFSNAAFSAAEGLWREVRGCPDANDCRHCGKCARLLALVSGK